MIVALLRLACVTGLALQAGCAAIDGNGRGALEAASPLAADPRALVVELTKPAALPVGDGDLSLAVRWGVPGGSVLEEEAGLRVVRIAPAPPARSGSARNTVDLMLAPGDAARIASLVAQIRNDRRKGIEGEGAFSVSFTAHCIAGGLDVSGMVIDVALAPEPGQPAIPLMSGANLGALLKSRGIGRLPDCAALALRDR